MNDIRTLTLRFANTGVTERFMSLAKSKGYYPSLHGENGWWKVSITFQNKTERSKFIAAWAKHSMEVIGA